MFDTVRLAQVLVETASGQSNFYVPGLAQYDGTDWQYFAKDRLGSVRQVVDPAGQLALAQTFDPFGNLLAQSGPGASAFGYTGEQTDPTDLVFLRARYYDPQVGRFLTADSIVPGPLRSIGWNRFAYVENNPVNYVDPSGHCVEPISGIVCISIGKLVVDAIAIGLAAYLIYDTSQEMAEILETFPGQTPDFGPLPGFSLNDVEFSCLEVGPGGSGVDIWPPVITTPLDGSPFPTFYGTPLEQPAVLGNGVLTANGRRGGGGRVINLGGTNYQFPVRTSRTDPTTGYLVLDTGEVISVPSGVEGFAKNIPKGTSGFNGLTKTHSEGHAAAYMRQNNIQSATLYINNDPCLGKNGCNRMLDRMIPEGASLLVVNPDSGFVQPYVNLPD